MDPTQKEREKMPKGKKKNVDDTFVVSWQSTGEDKKDGVQKHQLRFQLPAPAPARLA